MAGLLDVFNTYEGQQALGLLAAAGGRSDGAGFGQRLQEGLGSAEKWKQRQAQAEMQKQQAEFQKFQMDQARAQVMERQSAQEAAKRQQAGIPGLFRAPQTQGQISIPQMGGVDMFSQGAKVDTPSMRGPTGFDVQGALALGLTPDMIEKYASLNNIGKQEAKDWQDIEGPNGAKIRQAFDKYGQPIGGGVSGYVAPVQINQGGGGITFAKPVAGQNFPVTMTASEKDASARGWAGVRQGDQRLGFEREKFSFEKGNGSAKTTEGEKTAGALLQRLRSSQIQMEDALAGGKTGAEKPSLIAQGLRGVGAESMANTWNSPERQRVEAAQMDILDAALTLGTGAAYTRDQLEGYRKSYFPQIGDDASTVKDKQVRLQNILAAAEIKAGGAAKSVPTVAEMKAQRIKQAPPSGSLGSGSFQIISVE